MDQQQMKQRTKDFAKRVVALCEVLPARSREADLVARQLFRSATSVGANYRAACRARSRAEFVSKLSIVLEEADEALYWLEILSETRLAENSAALEMLGPLSKEANELVSIFVATINTAKDGSKNLKSEI